MEVEGFLREERVREDAVEAGVVEFSATPKQLLIANEKKVAMASMANLLHKVMIKTSLVCIELDKLPPR